MAVVILTHNAEADIGRCLPSVQGWWTAEVFAVDSLSTDATAVTFDERVRATEATLAIAESPDPGLVAPVRR